MGATDSVTHLTSAAEVIEPSSTAIMSREALGGPAWRHGVPWPWMLALLLTGGGSLAVGDVIGGGSGDKALAMAEQLEERQEKSDARLAAVEQRAEARDRMMRDSSRTTAWMVAYMTKLGAAIGSLAKADGVEVDVSVPPLLPADVVDQVPR